MKDLLKKTTAILLLAILFILTAWQNHSEQAATDAITETKSKKYDQVTIEANSSNKNGIDAFPESYQIMLNKLVDNTGHTNWKFKALYTDIDWNDLVKNETDCLHNTIYKSATYPYSSTWYHNCNKQGDSGYYCASEQIISYYMDPRNFITEIAIFQFLDLSNSSNVTVEQIKQAVKGTYLDGSVDGESYAQMIYEAAQESGESAFSIIVRIFQELGNGKELPYMISGKDPTYPGVYNFFNYGATDGEGNLTRGLAYAKKAGWTTPKKALVEGAKLIAGTYTKAGQVNKYLYKFDVIGENDTQLYRHQYMTNVEDPNSQANILYKAYDTNNLLDNSLTFVIPVYKNMPTYVKLPEEKEPTGELYYVSSNYTGVTWRQSPWGTPIGTLKKDTVVTMLEQNVNGFGKITYNGITGYMSMQYLTKVNTQKDIYNVPQKDGQYLGEERDENALITYSVGLQKSGWTKWAKDGEKIGIIGKNIGLETIKINLKENLKSEQLQYKVHVQEIGWMNWISDGNVAGAEGEEKTIEAIQIKLKDQADYDIQYKVCIEGNNWTDWVQNGEIAGTTGKAQKITAIQIKLIEKEKAGEEENKKEEDPKEEDKKEEDKKEEIVTEYSISYNTHVEDIGWMNDVKDGAMSGTTGQAKRVEAVRIKLDSAIGKNIKYRVHVEDYGWTSWVQNGELAGTVGEAKRIEAIEIKIE